MDVVHAAIYVERNPRTPAGSLAESISAVADRDLLRREDAADWVSGVLGISLARASPSVAVSEVDGGDGALRSTVCEEGVKRSSNLVIE